ncbi:hypothetical protein Q7A_03930 [Methylophaga nitratireducenticrescens]|uniref:hypothetical protein n=1 Tax=Methylophaga nitratireducenticrescens TaxID=754476 RepID=UPI00059E6FAA|nr:hypothetical protein [Methylophaga nitratireducenticrescens]ASF49182.1 hypothetical protein Q7A_03930 [Methylophaga nitratireducenticrescens]
MQVNNVSYATGIAQLHKSGNNLPLAKVQNLQESSSNSIRELAKSIDPSNMSRNEARAIVDAQRQAGEPIELDNPFLLHSMILVNENGQLRNATETDPIMNEKFNMFDAFKSEIEFNISKGLSTDTLEKGLDFLEKFKNLRETAEINLYA